MARWAKVYLKTRKREGFKSWIARWKMNGKDKYGRSFHDKDLAKEYRAALELFLNGKGPDPDATPTPAATIAANDPGPKHPWTETVDEWLRTSASRAKSKLTYKSCLTRFANARSIANVEDVTEAKIAEHLAGLRDDGASPATTAAYLRVLRLFFNRVGILNPSPVTKRLKDEWKPSKTRKRQRPHRYTEAEFLKIIAACDLVGVQKLATKGRGKGKLGRGLRPSIDRPPLWWKALLTLLYRTGLRLNEAAHLIWRDVDLSGATIHIRPHDTVSDVLPWRPKSEAGNRSIPVPADVVDLLQQIKDAQDVQAAKTGTSVPYVFLSLDRYLDVMKKRPGPEKDILRSVDKGFRRIRSRAGLTEGCLHDFRRSCITNWAETPGITPRDVQLLAGHEDLQTTLGIYHMVDGKSAADKLRASQQRQAKLPKATRRKIG